MSKPAVASFKAMARPTRLAAPVIRATLAGMGGSLADPLNHTKDCPLRARRTRSFFKKEFFVHFVYLVDQIFVYLGG